MQDPEVIKEKEAHVLEVTSGTFLQHPLNLLIDHYSSFYRLCKAVSWLLRFKMFLKEKTLIKGFVRRDEMVIAERHVVSFVQEGSFPVEIQQLKNNESVKLSSPLSKLTPMMLDGMMVVGGRLKHSLIPQRSKFPVILPRDHKVSFLIAQEEHNYAHLGVEWVLSRIRSRFWIIRARSLVKNIKHACITCKRLYAPAMSQKMSDLPDDRCKPNVPAFSCAGVDVFGPFYVKQGRASVKRYGCVFSCFSSRALHIEKLDDLSTSALINGLIRFCARRGPVRKIICDNGTNLVGAKNELIKSFCMIDKIQVGQAARRMKIDWEFHPPHASHHGGVYERMIRTVRRVLYAIVGKHGNLTDDVLTTVFCECENIVNSRPLTKCSDDVEDADPLTPNHLLLLRGNYAFQWTKSERGTCFRNDGVMRS